MKQLVTELPWTPDDDLAHMKLTKDQSFRCVVDPDNLVFRSRKDVAYTYFDWTLAVAKARGEWYSILAMDLAIFIASFLVSPWFLLLLIPAIPYTLRMQFNYGDVLDDSQTWADKKVTRVDG
jgi:hypothetical protein